MTSLTLSCFLLSYWSIWSCDKLINMRRENRDQESKMVVLLPSTHFQRVITVFFIPLRVPFKSIVSKKRHRITEVTHFVFKGKEIDKLRRYLNVIVMYTQMKIPLNF